MQPTLFISGANRGIGLGLVNHYLNAGYRVIATCRTPDKAQQLQALTRQYSTLHIHPLDINDQLQVEKLAKVLEDQSIDILINNAGIYGPKKRPLGELSVDPWREVMTTNAIAPVMLTQALLPSVLSGNEKKVAFISSKMASMEDNLSGGSYFYRASKAALNAAARSLAHDVASNKISVGIYHPGWVQTDMGGPNALISVEASVQGLSQQIIQQNLSTSGQFINFDGTPIPW